MNKIWAYDPNSFFSSCNNSVVGLIANTVNSILFIEQLSLGNIQDTSFALVTTLEFPYPITVFCYSASFEVYYDLLGRVQIFINYPWLLIENYMRKQGTILYNFMTAPDCLATLDGTCFGSKLGIAINYIFYP